jgi:chromate reductase
MLGAHSESGEGAAGDTVVGTSPGKIGTAIGRQHLRSILAFCNSPHMNSIEAYIQFERGLITEDGRITNPSVEEFLRNDVTELHGFIARSLRSCHRTRSATHRRVMTEGRRPS